MTDETLAYEHHHKVSCPSCNGTGGRWHDLDAINRMPRKVACFICSGIGTALQCVCGHIKSRRAVEQGPCRRCRRMEAIRHGPGSR